ncbi:MAG: hydroxymethylbilane synthase [Elusimicrobia bacterium]|nr:hydroxymethylbilane synthase [Elusimicrobiota bacterium]
MQLRMGLGTYGSLSARGRLLAQEFRFRCDGWEIEVVPIQTNGERLCAEAPGELPAGPDDLFTREIDEALLAGRIDFAMHRAEDVPACIPEGLAIGAFVKREDPREVFVHRDGGVWAGFGSGRLAVSSLRRKFQVAKARPGVTAVPLAGELSVRLSRMGEGLCDALVASSPDLASVARPGRPAEFLPLEDVVPAPGQGALALAARLDNQEVRRILRAVDDPLCRLEVEFERALLKALGPGSAAVLGALARSSEDGVSMTVFHCLPDGSKGLRLRRFCKDSENRDAFIAEIADQVRRSS